MLDRKLTVMSDVFLIGIGQDLTLWRSRSSMLNDVANGLEGAIKARRPTPVAKSAPTLRPSLSPVMTV